MAKATAAMDTKRIIIPTEYVGEIQKKMQEAAVIPALSASTPQLFEDAEHIFFTQEPEAEFVGEGAAKSSSEFKFEPKEGKIYKTQVTVRMNEEVEWADDDSKLKLLDALFDSMSGANARALDYGMIHAINPLTREVLASLKTDALAYTSEVVTSTGKPLDDIDALVSAVVENHDVTGIALDRMYANTLRTERNEYTGARLYPEIGLNLNPGSVDGITSVTSSAVSGKRLATTPTGILAILGNWNLIKWGIVREMAVTPIPYGDPDGLGDLKRYNQIAYRAEMVFSWANLDPTGFAVLKQSDDGDDGGDDGGDNNNGGGGDDGGDDTPKA